MTSRGRWYRYSWKGDERKSGGVATNIGVHFFDLLLWLFGPAEGYAVHRRDDLRAAGTLTLADADVAWALSIDADDLPPETPSGQARPRYGPGGRSRDS